jgi:hypothetical protein
MKQITWVYLIQDTFTGYYKIGFTGDPLRRLKELRTQKTLLPVPSDFLLVEAWQADKSNEKELHTYFAANNIRGEWFELALPDTVFINLYFNSFIRFSIGASDEAMELDRHIALTENGDNASYMDFVLDGLGYEF